MARTKRKVNPLAPAVEQAVQPRIYKVGGYARLSVEDGGKADSDTIEAQKGLLESYIVSRPDMKLHEIYCDNGHTGANFQRPGFERLMDDVRGGKIDCIVVKDLSRFGRNYKETDNYLQRIFPFLGVRFVAVNDGFDTLTTGYGSDGYIVPLKNILNEVYSKDISRKSCSALRVKQQNGEFIGSWAPYGYRKCKEDKHRLEPDPATAPIVQSVFNWRLGGMSYNKIAKRLNEEGVPTPAQYRHQIGEIKTARYDNAKWSIFTIKTIVENLAYLGHTVQGKKASGLCQGQKQHRTAKCEWVIVEDTHEPLIAKAAFKAVQEMSERASKAYKESLGRYDHLGGSPNILRGLVFCADCGKPLARSKLVSHDNRLYYTYICPTHHRDSAACPKKYLHETQLLETVWAAVRHEIALAGGMKKLAREYRQSPAAMGQQAAIERQITVAKQSLARGRTLYNSLYQNYIDRLLDEEKYLELKAQYRAEQERVQARAAELERQRAEQEHYTVDSPWLKNFTSFVDEDGLTDKLAHALIQRVEVDAENHIEITLQYHDEYCALAQTLGKAGPV